jgi:hypothetical protein
MAGPFFKNLNSNHMMSGGSNGLLPRNMTQLI